MVVSELDKASGPWGVKMLRYEIKNITPPRDVLAAMEKQMRAEREKRAVILASEGERDAAINNAEGQKQQVIKASEAKRQQQINEAQGQAEAILAIATATAEGIRKVSEVIAQPGGHEAVQLRVAEQYVKEFGSLAKATNTVILPASVSDVGSMIAMAMNVFRGTGGGPVLPTSPAQPPRGPMGPPPRPRPVGE
jgi:regulator of protease activity HflC (stomatin/prohibitin superfamily)